MQAKGRPGRSRLRQAQAAAAPRAPGRAAEERAQEWKRDWIYGRHAVAALLKNPARRIRRFVVLAEAEPWVAEQVAGAAARISGRPETLERDAFQELLPDGAVHQGVAIRADKLPEPGIDDVTEGAPESGRSIIVALDQVSDPQNIGAVLRSAAAFGARALVIPEHGSPEVSGALAKAASGALELVPIVRVVNLARALDRAKRAGFWVLGLDETADATLVERRLEGKIVLVLGSEGEGLRRLVREHCDVLARLPTKRPLASLNVSNAAAVALYELMRDAG